MTEWIIPCNLNLYDIFGAAARYSRIDWKQTITRVAPGDIVFIYVSKPVQSVCFKCNVLRTNKPERVTYDAEFIIDGASYRNYGRFMELEIVEKYPDWKYPLELLQAHGLRGQVQGPRRLDPELHDLLHGSN